MYNKKLAIGKEGAAVLEIDGICKSYAGHCVLQDVSFVLPAGHCLGIVGENGSGKSTLLRILAQVEKPDRGDVRWDGKSVLGDRQFLRRKLGYVPQSNDLMEDLTVRGQLKLWQNACDLSGSLPEEIMELLGIGPILKKRIRDLSGGMQRRVSIAMALMTRPEVLIMDEATTGLDRDYCEKLLAWLEGYLSRGGRILWCSHQKQELDRLCSGCFSMDASDR